MAVYSICGYTVDIDVDYSGYVENQYLCSEKVEKPDFTVRVTDEDIKYVSRKLEGEFPDNYFRWAAACYKLALMLPKKDTMLIHGVLAEADDRGIIFVAKSGVGKTTHAKLWKKMLGDRFKIINGDKPFVRFIDGIPYAYGTPWAGKEGFQRNRSVKLTDVCFVERSETNETESITGDKTKEYVARFLDQTLHPTDPEAMIKTLEMSDKIMMDCNLWRIGCTISEDAARVAYNAIIGGYVPSKDN